MKNLITIFLYGLWCALAMPQATNSNVLLSDARSMAMGEALTAANKYAPIESSSPLRYFDAKVTLPYLMPDLLLTSVSACAQKRDWRYGAALDYVSTGNIGIGLRAMKRFASSWQAGAAVHYHQSLRGTGADCLADQSLCYFPDDNWQIHVLLWHLLCWHDGRFTRLHTCHLSAAYEPQEDMVLLGELAYNGRGLTSHYAMEFELGKCLVRLGCRFPAARPSVGVAWSQGKFCVSTALSYDFRLGPSMCASYEM